MRHPEPSMVKGLVPFVSTTPKDQVLIPSAACHPCDGRGSKNVATPRNTTGAMRRRVMTDEPLYDAVRRLDPPQRVHGPAACADRGALVPVAP
jgi:hypothetical protein